MKDLAIAYAMRKRAMKRKMASGGVVEPEEQMHATIEGSLDPMEESQEHMAEPMMHEEMEPPKKKRGLIEAIMHKAHQRHFGK